MAENRFSHLFYAAMPETGMEKTQNMIALRVNATVAQVFPAQPGKPVPQAAFGIIPFPAAHARQHIGSALLMFDAPLSMMIV
jgi:hypothetical protein